MAPLAAQKTDTVVIRNGDILTGEIKKLHRGKLEYSTDDFGTVYIEWDKIIKLISVHYFEFELAEGEKLYGKLPDTTVTRQLVIVLPTFAVDTVAMEDVVGITPIKAGFWARTSGYVDFSFDLTRANRQTTWSLAGQGRYRGEKWGGGLTGSSYFQFQTDSTTGQTTRIASRNSADFAVNRFVKHASALGGQIGLEQNEELDLDLRTQLMFVYQRFVLRTHHVEIAVVGGASGNSEQYDGVDTTVQNLEATVGFSLNAFRYDSPKLDASANFPLFFGITTFARVRFQFDGRIQYEVIKDFHVMLSGYLTYDSQPPTADAVKADYRLSFGLGWSWS